MQHKRYMQHNLRVLGACRALTTYRHLGVCRTLTTGRLLGVCRTLITGRLLAIRISGFIAALGVLLLFFSCVTEPAVEAEFPVFRESRPRSILVMPPVNLSPDIKAGPAFLATSTLPLSEAGYYVIPVTLSDEVFKQNGLSIAEEAQAVPPRRLFEIFGADAALYITITRFGTRYVLIDSVVEAAASATLVDLRNGLELWSGRVSVTEGSSNAGEGLLGMLLNAALSQVVNTLIDRSYEVGRQANHQMLSAGKRKGILYGPYHPMYGTD